MRIFRINFDSIYWCIYYFNLFWITWKMLRHFLFFKYKFTVAINPCQYFANCSIFPYSFSIFKFNGSAWALSPTTRTDEYRSTERATHHIRQVVNGGLHMQCLWSAVAPAHPLAGEFHWIPKTTTSNVIRSSASTAANVLHRQRKDLLDIDTLTTMTLNKMNFALGTIQAQPWINTWVEMSSKTWS